LAVTGCFIAILPDMPPVCRDPDDDRVPAAAIAASASHIVTGDADLLDLHEHQGICLLTARQFLEGLAV
jgi:predicted nucleic acid-binding protein